jgi:hypothetical protein
MIERAGARRGRAASQYPFPGLEDEEVHFCWKKLSLSLTRVDLWSDSDRDGVAIGLGDY